MTDQRAAASFTLKALLGAIGTITILTIASRIVGFVRSLAQYTWVGHELTASVYTSANQIPNVVAEVIAGGALTGMVVPLLAFPVARGMREDIDRIASVLLSWTILLLFPAGALVTVFAPQIASLFGIPAGPATELAVILLRIFAVQVPFYGISIVLTGILQAHRKFLWPAFVPLLSSAVVILAYAWFGYLAPGADINQLSTDAILVLGWGTTLGVVALSMPLLIPVLRLGVRLRPTLILPLSEARKALILAGAGLCALIAQQLSLLFVLVAGAWRYGTESTPADWGYVLALYYLPHAIFVVPYITAIFPHLSELGYEKDRSRFIPALARSAQTVTILAIGAVGLLMAVAPEAQDFFSLIHPISDMAVALVAFAPGLLGLAWILHLSRILYMVGASRPAVGAQTLGWLVVALGSVLLARFVGPHIGEGRGTLISLGLAQSGGLLLAGILLLITVRLRLGREALAGLEKTIGITIPLTLLGLALGRLLSDSLFAVLSPGLMRVILCAVLAVLATFSGTALGFLIARKLVK